MRGGGVGRRGGEGLTEGVNLTGSSFCINYYLPVNSTLIW